MLSAAVSSIKIEGNIDSYQYNNAAPFFSLTTCTTKLQIFLPNIQTFSHKIYCTYITIFTVYYMLPAFKIQKTCFIT